MNDQRKSHSAAACFSALADEAKSAEMVKQHEFAGGGDDRESAAAAAAAQSALKAHGIAVSAWQHLNAAVEKAPPRMKNAGAQIRSKLLNIVDQIDEFYEALNELT